jgi:nucleoside-diphosphate-sugar epimerase
LVIENPTKSTNQIFNVTFGKARSIKDLLGVLQKEFGEFPIEYTRENLTTPRRGTLIVDKIVKTLGYAPCHPLESGYRDLIRWYKNQVSKD